MHVLAGRLHLPRRPAPCRSRRHRSAYQEANMISLFVLALQAATGRITADTLGRPTL
jgi:hypothetical protein